MQQLAIFGLGVLIGLAVSFWVLGDDGYYFIPKAKK